MALIAEFVAMSLFASSAGILAKFDNIMRKSDIFLLSEEPECLEKKSDEVMAQR